MERLKKLVLFPLEKKKGGVIVEPWITAGAYTMSTSSLVLVAFGVYTVKPPAQSTSPPPRAAWPSSPTARPLWVCFTPSKVKLSF